MRTDGQTEMTRLIVAFEILQTPPKSVPVLNYGPLDEEVIRSEGMAPHILKFGTR
jgi:hypothetical protein